MNESDNSNSKGGPRTEEGKQRSSQNAIKHGIFGKSILIPGESQEEFDKLLYHYNKDYRPKGAPEENLVRILAETEWRRRRLPALEARALENSLETGDVECKFMHTYGIYEQRLNRTFQITLKTFLESRARRTRENIVDFGLAAVLYRNAKTKETPWNPADDGFVFSYPGIERQYDLCIRLLRANEEVGGVATEEEIAEFLVRGA